MSDTVGLAFAVVALVWVVLKHWDKLPRKEPLSTVASIERSKDRMLLDALGKAVANLTANDTEMQRQLDSLKAGLVVKSAFSK